MANRLIRLLPISGASDAEGDFTGQQQVQTVTGMVEGIGVAIDASDNLYVADFDRHVIFVIRRGTEAVVLAGSPGNAGLQDGQGSAARFDRPTHIAVTPSGDIYVVDSGNARIRRVTSDGNVYTVAAIPALGADQVGGIAVDNSGQIFLIDNS
jgi:DNA-binding beta-propeller fold protein YncE